MNDFKFYYKVPVDYKMGSSSIDYPIKGLCNFNIRDFVYKRVTCTIYNTTKKLWRVEEYKKNKWVKSRDVFHIPEDWIEITEDEAFLELL